MDVGFYISELLEQYGEISVPGLGFLVRSRMPAYYNEVDGKLYPPYYQVQFDPQEIEDDDKLARYIAGKKNISVASSKFFTEKYIITIKDEALIKEVPLSNLGSFYMEKGGLLFKAANNTINDPDFFGFPPVKINKIGQLPVPETVIDQPVAPEINDGELTGQQTVASNEGYEAAEYKSSYTWLIALLILLIVAAAIFGLYQYTPSSFEKAWTWGQKITNRTPVPKQKAVARKVAITAIIPPKQDTADTNKVKLDTSGQTPAPAVPANQNNSAGAAANKIAPAGVIAKQSIPADNAARQSAPVGVNPNAHWEIIAFACKTQAGADKTIAYFNKEGIAAYISTYGHGPRIKIAIGPYNTNDEADAARIKLTRSQKIPKDAYLEEINLKK